MNRVHAKARRSEKGFTLVELAIVMIIIGLLITGVLKGQEMIANAQVTSTVTQIKAIDAATSTFKDMYNSFPGDMLLATTRLNSCANPCNNGDGDGRIDQGVGAAPALGQENVFFFTQMRAADLLSGFDGTNTLAFGSALPTAPVGGGFSVGHTNPNGGATSVTGFTAANMRLGHYLVHNGVPNAAVGATSGLLSPAQAARIDRKMDDGIPTTGSVHGNTGGTCISGGLYDEDATNGLCAMAIRIQG